MRLIRVSNTHTTDNTEDLLSSHSAYNFTSLTLQILQHSHN